MNLICLTFLSFIIRTYNYWEEHRVTRALVTSQEIIKNACKSMSNTLSICPLLFGLH